MILPTCPIFDTDINISENGTSAVAMKSELIMSIIETARGLPLSAADKSIIDSCVKEVYADYVLNNGNPEFTPTFVDFYNALINKKLPEADQIALDIELYVNGSSILFRAKQTFIRITSCCPLIYPIWANSSVR